jgi:chorismate mutase
MTNTENLRLEIDQLNLDKEWLGQPNQRYYWGQELAKAHMELDKAKANLRVVEAEMDKAIRRDFKSYGLSKITEASVAHAVKTCDEYIEAERKMIDCKYEVGIVQAAIDGLEHRKRALTLLVDLFKLQYSDESDSLESRATEKIKKAIRIRKK